MNINQARFLRWVLVETSHPGNVGSAARALKTMGFEQLRLVNPNTPDIAKQADAIAMASGAVDILESCSVSDSLDTTVQGCSMVVGLTSREREFGPPAIDWESACQLIAQTVQNQGYVAHGIWSRANRS
ncbi:RNA methyltransferase [Polynucleobacter necessarius]|uniref:RNA methyltransferase n=1 Tax=Polynucleobacter necessarius TaxID=576610 RepID=UPI001E3239EE|nr:RNA methyltransferase [Polynucleobacter necessarius]